MLEHTDMNKSYDFVYLTNTPSFYKLNLCNEIAKTHSLLLVLYGYGAEAVNKEMSDGQYNFDYCFINQGDSNRRSKLKTFVNLMRLMRRVKAKKIIYAGWMSPEYNLYSFISPKYKNVMVCESSIIDVSLQGWRGAIKRAIISRMGSALPSGRPHAELFKSIGFKGTVHITGSVGIFNKGKRETNLKPNSPLKYIYVGRLVDVKNVGMLIEAFNANSKPLTIVGKGVMEKELKAKANSNITFSGFIDNEQLGAIYQAHDVFILPSKSETWGLVVEEAIYWGLPVIVSDHVGSHVDMVDDLGTGAVFKSDDIDSLNKAIADVEANYDKYKQNVMNVDWQGRDKRQVEAYTSLIEK